MIEERLQLERTAGGAASGRPGAARELKTRTNVFLGWAVDEGLIFSNPLAGWRRPRATRAERIDRPGRALTGAEIYDRDPRWAPRVAAAERWSAHLTSLIRLDVQSISKK
ncbi:MAG: hypothetical protein ACREH3_06525 [Geminicoccales bacterium]